MSSVFKRLQPADFIVTPFEAYKTWEMTSANASSSFDTYVFYGTYQTSSELTTAESVDIPSEWNSWPQTINGEYQTSIHSAIYNAFNKQWEGAPLNTLGPFIVGQKRHQYKYIHVVSIPQQIMGDRIKLGSVQITSSQSPTIYLKDDSKGNLYDMNLSSSMSSSISDDQHLMGEWTYEEHYKNRTYLAYEKWGSGNNDWMAKKNIYNNFPVIDYSKYQNHGVTTGSRPPSSNSANSFFLTSQSLTPYVSLSDDRFNAIQIPHQQRYNFEKNQDFAVSTWIRPIISQSSDTNLIIGKLGGVKKVTLTVNSWNGAAIIPPIDVFIPKLGPYPFAMTISSSNQINCSRYDGQSYSRVTSSAMIDNTDFTNVIFQKTGSILQIFLDGVLSATGSDNLGGSTCNDSDVWIGGIPKWQLAPILPGQYTGFQGLYSTRIYSKALSEAEAYTLYKTKYNSPNVGNVSYNTAQITVTNPTSTSGNYTGSFSYWDTFRVGANNVDTYTGWTDPTTWAYAWNMKYKSTVTIHQNEILCTVPPSSFNLSFNPTLRETSTNLIGCDHMSIDILKGITTHSFFNPYATTIGLYNDRCEMVAIAKLARPIQMINNADLTFVVRLDIDSGLGGGGTGVYPPGGGYSPPIKPPVEEGEKDDEVKDAEVEPGPIGYFCVRPFPGESFHCYEILDPANIPVIDNQIVCVALTSDYTSAAEAQSACEACCAKHNNPYNGDPSDSGEYVGDDNSVQIGTDGTKGPPGGKGPTGDNYGDEGGQGGDTGGTTDTGGYIGVKGPTGDFTGDTGTPETIKGSGPGGTGGPITIDDNMLDDLLTDGAIITEEGEG